MDRPPAALDAASMLRQVNSSAPSLAFKSATAACRPMVTSPSSTLVGAIPWPTNTGAFSRPSKALTRVVVEPISATSASTCTSFVFTQFPSVEAKGRGSPRALPWTHEGASPLDPIHLNGQAPLMKIHQVALCPAYVENAKVL